MTAFHCNELAIEIVSKAMTEQISVQRIHVCSSFHAPPCTMMLSIMRDVSRCKTGQGFAVI